MVDLPRTDERASVAEPVVAPGADSSAPSRPADAEAEPAPLVDWVVTARRVGRSSAVLLGLALLGWVVRAAIVDAWSWSHLGNWLGLALAGIFVVELFVVGGSALRGMLRAGERGERLASHDVGLLPPIRRRRAGRDHQRE